MEMNCQIGELTSMVSALFEEMSSSMEDNGQNVQNVETSPRSDKFRNASLHEIEFKVLNDRDTSSLICFMLFDMTLGIF